MKELTIEEKQLLLQDLCARFPYDTLYADIVWEDGIAQKMSFVNTGVISDLICDEIKNIKPYLRSISSMTEKEKEEYRNIDNRSYSCPIDYAHIPASDRIDWLNSHHFDYRGLIEKGLAIEAPEGMYK